MTPTGVGPVTGQVTPLAEGMYRRTSGRHPSLNAERRDRVPSSRGQGASSISSFLRPNLQVRPPCRACGQVTDGPIGLAKPKRVTGPSRPGFDTRRGYPIMHNPQPEQVVTEGGCPECGTPSKSAKPCDCQPLADAS